MLRLCFTNETKFVRVHELDWKTTLGKVVAMPSVEGMSVKEMREELATLGSSAEGCWERSEIEEKLRQVRQAKGGHALKPENFSLEAEGELPIFILFYFTSGACGALPK